MDSPNKLTQYSSMSLFSNEDINLKLDELIQKLSSDSNNFEDVLSLNGIKESIEYQMNQLENKFINIKNEFENANKKLNNSSNNSTDNIQKILQDELKIDHGKISDENKKQMEEIKHLKQELESSKMQSVCQNQSTSGNDFNSNDQLSTDLYDTVKGYSTVNLNHEKRESKDTRKDSMFNRDRVATIQVVDEFSIENSMLKIKEEYEQDQDQLHFQIYLKKIDQYYHQELKNCQKILKQYETNKEDFINFDDCNYKSANECQEDQELKQHLNQAYQLNDQLRDELSETESDCIKTNDRLNRTLLELQEMRQMLKSMDTSADEENVLSEMRNSQSILIDKQNKVLRDFDREKQSNLDRRKHNLITQDFKIVCFNKQANKISYDEINQSKKKIKRPSYSFHCINEAKSKKLNNLICLNLFKINLRRENKISYDEINQSKKQIKRPAYSFHYINEAKSKKLNNLICLNLFKINLGRENKIKYFRIIQTIKFNERKRSKAIFDQLKINKYSLPKKLEIVYYSKLNFDQFLKKVNKSIQLSTNKLSKINNIIQYNNNNQKQIFISNKKNRDFAYLNQLKIYDKNNVSNQIIKQSSKLEKQGVKMDKQNEIIINSKINLTSNHLSSNAEDILDNNTYQDNNSTHNSELHILDKNFNNNIVIEKYSQDTHFVSCISNVTKRTELNSNQETQKSIRKKIKKPIIKPKILNIDQSLNNDKIIQNLDIKNNDDILGDM